MAEFHTTYDLLVTPTLPIEAFEAGHESRPTAAGEDWTGWTPFTYPFNMTQQPAATVPCGLTRTGSRSVSRSSARRHADAVVLRAAHAFEAAMPFATVEAPRAPS